MKNTIWLSCGVLRAELTELLKLDKISGELLFLDSMLHMNPPELEEILTSYLKHRNTNLNIVLIYGDCCSRMLNLVKDYHITRVDAINCAQMLLGKVRYRELMHFESFLLLPEWTLRWQEIMSVELGLNAENAKSLMRENRKELVYLDTGLVAVPEDYLIDCSEYTGLPWRVEKTGLCNLLIILQEAANRLISNQYSKLV